ncbi:hypothetical protein BX616_009026 [Lobosporangium transversale]|uniref:F-box domain-containing protein n=1 Tax=Lobosporangium transversale TaxID=64571 RepID=A0A1Y2GWI5_9FUNG|nr:hypothetical protein BCR41DRAFT_368203 [Lobosporangium transversale]KAF9914075.1 hypothetical protein BX616_009026 [Lobosporangium transversale]ORZ26658.1 hypothetical protein BCR41DRAFT_368203 [Lobosporangium transversale]|eukprot:XP_021884421.1 hypothetical protein BCR41DRAFT_368203 [Lobosporangium transversale]
MAIIVGSAANVNYVHPRGPDIWLYVVRVLYPNQPLKCMEDQVCLLHMNKANWTEINLLDFNLKTELPNSYPVSFGKVKADFKNGSRAARAMAEFIHSLTIASMSSLSALGPKCVNLVQLTHIPSAWILYDWTEKYPFEYLKSVAAFDIRATEILASLIQRNRSLQSVCLQLPAAYRNPFEVVDALGTLPHLKTLGISGERSISTKYNFTYIIIQRIIERCRNLQTLVVGGNICGTFPTYAAQIRSTNIASLNRSLKTLDLNGTTPFDCFDPESVIKRCPRLVKLALPSCMPPNVLLGLSEILSKHCRLIECVVLEYCELEELSFKAFVRSFHRLSQLKILRCPGFKASMLMDLLDVKGLSLLDTLRLEFDIKDRAGMEEAAVLIASLPGNIDHPRLPCMQWVRRLERPIILSNLSYGTITPNIRI